MATDLERLVVQLSADIKGYQSEMQRAAGITNRQARAIEARWKQSERNLSAIGSSMARGLIAPLTGVAAALTTREVLSYADAWTKAKNSLAVAGVTGVTQAAVLERLYQSAQANSTPIGALADLFGKAAQASDNLGASNEELIKFSDGVAVALRVAGTGATEASGALTQLGQLLGSARVQAEEFNSVNEGARPILIAVANGLDAAGGSVNKLKQLVNDGKVSGQQFFQAFLKGLPSIQSMAASSAQTIDQGVTKVTNALTKYIGQTDESLSASQRLVSGLNLLADNFGETADVVVQLASIIAGALVGRSIAGMIAKLGLATTAVQAFIVAIRNAVRLGSLATAIGGISAAAGPIGLVVGGTAVAALTLFSSTASTASAGAKVYANALKEVEAAANSSAAAINKTSASISQEMANRLTAGVRQGEQEIGRAKDAALSLFSAIIENAPRRLVSDEQISSLEEMRDKLRTGSSTAEETKNALFALANANPTFQRLADQMAPLLATLANAIAATKTLKEQLAAAAPPSFRQAENASMAAYEKMQQAGQAFIGDLAKQNALTKDQLALEKEIAEIRKEAQAKGVTLSERDIKRAAQDRLAAEKRRSGEGKKTPLDTSYRLDEDLAQVKARTAALAQEAQIVGLSTAEQEKRRVALDLEQQALSELRKEAQQKGVEDLDAITLSEEQRANIDAVAEAYGRQAAATELAHQQQQRLHDLQQEFGSLAEDGIMGLVDGTKNLNDVLADTLKLMAQMILKSALLGEGPLGTGSGGLIGSITKGLTGALSGGGFADGGYTGSGGKNDPAGVVHRGEVVWSQDDIRRAGGVAVVEAMRRGRKGYAGGGPVGLPSMTHGLTLPKIQPAARGGSMTFSPVMTIDARGSQMGEAQFRAILAENNRALLKQVPAAAEAARRRTPTINRT
ncbi:tape measure protein [Xanthobacter sp. V0B-10]|uniref:tape measure protein n=1 Tax=Xanthobacter albus TaxID=3119929 RepID=UPI0037265FB1